MLKYNDITNENIRFIYIEPFFGDAFSKNKENELLISIFTNYRYRFKSPSIGMSA